MERAVFGTILEQREEEQEAGRNVGSIRRGSQQVANVVTSQRRDVSANSVSSSLKAKGPEMERGSENVWTRAWKALQQRPRSAERRLVFVFFFFSEKLLMFYRLITCIIKSSMF